MLTDGMLKGVIGPIGTLTLAGTAAMFLTACTTTEELMDAVPNGTTELLTVGFGSCNQHDAEADSAGSSPFAYWDSIRALQPDVWVWGGDMVYGDVDGEIEGAEEKRKTLQGKYQSMRSEPAYRTFLEDCSKRGCDVVGIWDDHDFGRNDMVGNPIDPEVKAWLKAFPQTERKALAVEFLGEPTATAVADRRQLYASYDYRRDGVLTRIILLDLRSNRTPSDKKMAKAGRAGQARMMDDSQWTWLEHNLNDASVDVALVVSSTQVLRESGGLARKDTWGFYNGERKRLLDIIGKSSAREVILLSGDIHGGEVSVLDGQDAQAYGIDKPLYEITSSGLTRKRPFYLWTNRHRQGFAPAKNFGGIEIVRDTNGNLAAIATVYNLDGTANLRKTIPFSRP